MTATERILIIGWPRAGKTTLATLLGKELGVVPRHTDDLIGQLDWSAASAAVATWLDAPGPWIIEGVAGARALRKWREAHPDQPPPIDRIINLDEPHAELSPRQTGMGKGCNSVLAELVEWLTAAGIPMETSASRRAEASK